MNPLDLFLSADILAATLRSGIPLLLLGLGGLICHRAGVFNVALEGLLLIGCFAAVAGSAWSGSATVGVVTALVAATATAFLLAVGSIARQGNPLILGTAVNVLAAGITPFALQALFHVRGTYHRPDLARLPHWFAAAEHTVPWIGPALAAVSPLGLLALLAVPATAIFLYHTVAGMRLRGIGIHAEAAQSLGVRPDRFRFAALLASGALGGLAGAELSLGSVALFTENMSAGRGWIIVLILLLTGGRLRPMLGTLLVYAYTQALGFRLQTVGLPMQFGDAAPYLATLVTIVVVGIRATRATTTIRGGVRP
ncbi:simple sugar transport system permease protein [Nocardia transvalensis]|uniref:Simple sugar transport system permease protein n=1 Tax=Nocardia transvalensis TaxID=37333 RepID=A0A7W9UKR4_9NOCA|nr:ABC transporter permease [Nocardia transvalensis]MBB5916577.1 simple sugar transport system permease protein [Nocardia transvalensis]